MKNRTQARDITNEGERANNLNIFFLTHILLYVSSIWHKLFAGKLILNENNEFLFWNQFAFRSGEIEASRNLAMTLAVDRRRTKTLPERNNSVARDPEYLTEARKIKD